MDQLIIINNTLFSTLCNVTIKQVLLRESVLVVESQKVLMYVLQCESFLTVTFNCMVFLIDILIKMSSFTLCGNYY